MEDVTMKIKEYAEHVKIGQGTIRRFAKIDGFPVLHIGLPDRFVEQGERGELLAECGLDAEGVYRRLAAWGALRSS